MHSAGTRRAREQILDKRVYDKHHLPYGVGPDVAGSFLLMAEEENKEA